MALPTHQGDALASLDLSSADDLQRYLLASLSARGHGAPLSAARFRRAAHWFSSLYALGWDRLPFFMVYDLGHLLLEGAAFPFRSLLASADAPLDPASPDQHRRVSYENRLLNRLLSLPIFSSVRAAIDDAPGSPDPRVIATLSCWLAPLRAAPLLPITTSAQTLRQVNTPPALSAEQAVFDTERALDADGLFASQAEVAVEVMSGAPLASLIQPEDLFIIQHAEALSSDALRLTARQLASLEQRLGDADPPPAHLRREPPQTQVNLTDAGFFPQGGLDQLANRGSIENLVRTELAYIDDASPIDLFTMRYLEGELLYYTRDDAQLLRRSRTTHVALDLTHAHHIQYPGHPAQLSLLLRALTARLIDDLFTLFSSDSLRVVLRLHDRRAAEAADLWRIRFSDAIARGDLEVVIDDASPIPSDADADSLGLCAQRLVTPGRLTTLIWISAASPLSPLQAAALARDGLHLLHLQLPAPPPPAPTSDADAPPPLNPLAIPLNTPDILAALRAARQRLLWALFGC
jgi:hypothetical protein